MSSPSQHRFPAPRRLLAAFLALAVCLAAACSPTAPPQSTGSAASAAPAPPASSTPSSSSGPGIEVENCGAGVHLPAPPARIVLLDSSAVATLDALGALDRAVARGGAFPMEYYDADLARRVAAIPTLTDRVDASGHVRVSLEAVIALEPDLVLGSTDTVNRATTDPIPLVQDPGYCGAIGEADWGDVAAHVDLYATLLDAGPAADALRARLADRVSELEARAAQRPGAAPRVAVLFPAGAVTYAYGRGSMSMAMTRSAGLDNVFADAADRVFEVGAEELARRDPELIVALYSEGTAEDAVAAVATNPGAAATTAVAEGRVLPMLLNFAEPPTPLAVDGLAQLVAWLETAGPGAP